MDVREPHVRRRGFFLHSTDTGEPDNVELDNAEGFSVRFRTARSETPRQLSSIRRSRAEMTGDEGGPQIRSGSVTGSRQRTHSPR